MSNRWSENTTLNHNKYRKNLYKISFLKFTKMVILVNFGRRKNMSTLIENEFNTEQKNNCIT